MRMLKDLGMSFPSENSRAKRHYAIYECPLCGKHFKNSMYAINGGYVKSCGCLRKNNSKEMRTKHGQKGKRIYNIWCAMKARCYYSNYDHYERYGGRGIIVCDEWKNDFRSFYSWAMRTGYSDSLEIDRIDNDGNYCPENCKWSTHVINSQNTSMRKDNTSGYKGVNKHGNKWRAIIVWNKKKYILGRFNTPKEAGMAYNNFVIEHKTFHNLNVIRL